MVAVACLSLVVYLSSSSSLEDASCLDGYSPYQAPNCNPNHFHFDMLEMSFFRANSLRNSNMLLKGPSPMPPMGQQRPALVRICLVRLNSTGYVGSAPPSLQLRHRLCGARTCDVWDVQECTLDTLHQPRVGVLLPGGSPSQQRSAKVLPRYAAKGWTRRDEWDGMGRASSRSGQDSLTPPLGHANPPA
uniref:Uncharacterized protein n=1 Tax=Mycena chlorophos TaxID=658473 RepID=A0ABQ0KUT3_MYCCL|nr:predicted protein [Mycena chlorophos]